MRILDYGCGNCTLGASLAHLYGQKRSWGCDIEKWAEKEISSRPNIEFNLIKENKKTPYNDNFFDVILVSHVFHHLRDKNFVMKELYRILSKEGFLFVVEHDAHTTDKYLIELHHLLYMYIQNNNIFSRSSQGSVEYFSDYFSLIELRDIMKSHNFHYVKHVFQNKFSREKLEQKIL